MSSIRDSRLPTYCYPLGRPFHVPQWCSPLRIKNITFVILAFVSPVTYSIASLFKRSTIICIALVWFNAHVHPIQGVGISLLLLGIRIITRCHTNGAALWLRLGSSFPHPFGISSSEWNKLKT